MPWILCVVHRGHVVGCVCAIGPNALWPTWKSPWSMLRLAYVALSLPDSLDFWCIPTFTQHSLMFLYAMSLCATMRGRHVSSWFSYQRLVHRNPWSHECSSLPVFCALGARSSSATNGLDKLPTVTLDKWWTCTYSLQSQWQVGSVLWVVPYTMCYAYPRDCESIVPCFSKRRVLQCLTCLVRPHQIVLRTSRTGMRAGINASGMALAFPIVPLTWFVSRDWGHSNSCVASVVFLALLSSFPFSLLHQWPTLGNLLPWFMLPAYCSECVCVCRGDRGCCAGAAA